MTTYLGKSCLFGLPRVPFVNCRQFMYLVISLLVLRAGCGIGLYQFLIIAYLFTLKALNISKAAGPDGIRQRVLKELSSELAHILTLLFKASQHQRSLPDIWKHANVSPIYKKEDKTNLSNYRPVSSTCISCKLLEHIICSNLNQHLKRKSIL